MKSSLIAFLKTAKVRLALMGVGLFFIILYECLGFIKGARLMVYTHVIKKIHYLLASACDSFSFSVAEVLIIIFGIGVIGYLIFKLVYIIRKFFNHRNILSDIGDIFITCSMLFCLIYGAFCMLWGVYYDASSIDEICGLHSDGVYHEDLVRTCDYFAGLVNEYAPEVSRDDGGHYVMDYDATFDYGPRVYDAVSADFPGLSGNDHKPKPFHFSRIMSYLDFSGFFFPFTAEANINIEEPPVLTPSTIAHELAHQRGIAAEDEANFAAVLACVMDDNIDYKYSGSVLGFIYLQNALKKSGDMENWKRIYESLDKDVLIDLQDNSDYWKQFRKTVVYKVSNSTYDAFLKSYNQEKGVETYGECVDLLVDYFSHF